MVGASAAPSHSPRTAGWPTVSTTRPFANASPAATHSAARRMSPAWTGSRLTLGIARNAASRSSTSEDGVTAIDRDHLPRHPRRLLGDEEEDAVRDVVGRPEPPRRDRLDEPAPALLAVALVLRDRRRVREHEARRDRVDRDPEAAELMRRLPGEADLARLGARVGLDAREAHAAPGAGRDVDDATVAALLHPRRNRARAHERAGQVRVDDRAPVVVGHLLERPADLADHTARVVDEDVDAPDRADEVVHLRGVRDVDRVLVAAVDDGACALERGRDR